MASRAGGGHTADTVYGGRGKVLGQTVAGMLGGVTLAEHQTPREGHGPGAARAEALEDLAVLLPSPGSRSLGQVVDSTSTRRTAIVLRSVRDESPAPEPRRHHDGDHGGFLTPPFAILFGRVG